jgi:excisionase family DNA binding protein
MPSLSRSRTPVRGTRTIAEAARLFGCSYAAVVSMLDRGELPHIAAGNRRLIPIASIEAKLGKSVAELEAGVAA